MADVKGLGRPINLASHLWLVELWLAVIVITTIHRPDFLSQQTLLAVAFTMAVTGVIAVGAAVTIMSGGTLDLSIPAATMFPAWMTAMVSTAHKWPLPLVLLAAVAAGMSWGLFNVAIILLLKLPPILVTLATNFIGVAVLNIVFLSVSIPASAPIAKLMTGSTFGFPSMWWIMLAVVAIAAFYMSRTRQGRHVRAIGGSATAARRRGINLRNVRVRAFTIAGACYGLAGAMFAGSQGYFHATDTANYLLSVLAAVLISGVGLQGGEGSFFLVLIGVGLLATINSALVFWKLSSALQNVLAGVVLTLAVAGDAIVRKRRTR